MAKAFIVFGTILAIYTLVAILMDLPQVSDFLPVDLFAENNGEFYKIVPSNEPSYANYYVVGGSIFLIVAGLLLNKMNSKNE